MSERKKQGPTPEQQRVIDARDAIIVSASAGSGKTYVMIERLIGLITGGEDVRNLLAVTFTSKAAAQMRERLRAALMERMCEGGADTAHLKAQLDALPLAEISTIHAFCGRLVRSYFYLADVDPAFRIIDPKGAEGMTLSARAMDAVFEAAYEREDPDLTALLRVYYAKNSDETLRAVLRKIYTSVRGFADYRDRLQKMGDRSLFDRACGEIAEDADRTLRELRRLFDVRREMLTEAGGDLCETVEGILDDADACAQGDLFARRDAFQALRLRTRKAKYSKTDRTPEQEAAIGFYEQVRAEVNAIKKMFGAIGTREEELARFDSAAQIAAALGRLLLAYDDAFAAEKREAGALDYNDLEHFTLEILRDEAVRAELRARYRVVFVDEYQDVNPVQEAILSGIAGEEVFLVGDAKQAIYGFRGSDSAFFERKTREMTCMPLSRNFRSAENILAAVNCVFEDLVPGYEKMEGGERYGEKYKGEVCFHALDKGEKELAAERGVYSVLGHAPVRRPDAFGRQAANLIRSELGTTWYDVDAEQEKKVQPGDIVVLCRKRTGDAESIAAALAELGIPYTTSSDVNILDCPEVQLLIEWLKYIDNPEQDIPYVTALLSFAGGMTECELLRVRRTKGAEYGSFRAACKAFREQNPDDAVAKKLLRFEELTERLRVHARVRTAADLMNELLAEGLEVQIAARPGGAECLARARRLVAEGEETGVNAFLARIRMKGMEIKFSPVGGDNAVQILTIHASKGLEYPVVFLAGTEDDLTRTVPPPGEPRGAADVRWTEEFLAAPMSFDCDGKTYSENILRMASKLRTQAEDRKGGQNLLYVAMTRAKYRLHVLFKRRTNKAASPALAKQFSDLVDLEKCSRYFSQSTAAPEAVPVRHDYVHRPDEERVARILAVYQKPYRYADSVYRRVKNSATGLLHEQALEAPAQTGMSGTFTGKTSKEAGTAYHAFLQHVRYGSDAGEEIGRMLACGELTQQQADLLDAEELRRILAIPCLASLPGRRIRREQTFLMRLPASEIEEGAPDEEVIYQGAIDLLVERDDGYEVIDYKYSELDDEELRKKYGVQIRLYRKAVARAMRVDEATVRARIVNIARYREIEM